MTHKGRMCIPQSLQARWGKRGGKNKGKEGGGEGKSSKPLAVIKSHSKLP